MSDASGGAGVTSIKAGSPAARAGLRSGDVITAIGGKATGSSADAVGAIDAHRPGDKLSLTVRRGGADRVLQVTLVERPS